MRGNKNGSQFNWNRGISKSFEKSHQMYGDDDDDDISNVIVIFWRKFYKLFLYSSICPFHSKKRKTNKQTNHPVFPNWDCPSHIKFIVDFIHVKFSVFFAIAIFAISKEKRQQTNEKKNWKLSLTKFITLLSHCPLNAASRIDHEKSEKNMPPVKCYDNYDTYKRRKKQNKTKQWNSETKTCI